jgi:hypothetical protein
MTDTRKVRLQLGLQWAAARLSYGLTNYRHPLRSSALRAVRESHERANTSTTPLECVELYTAVGAAEKVVGDMAEAGVYLGGTALVMLSASGKRLHLFDTFAGLPHEEGPVFHAGGWAGSVETVGRNLDQHADRVEFHPGLFPGSAADLGHLRFSFVHLDLDLYDSTLAALEWFWPRLVPGGMLLSHDYPLSAGVTRAFDEFFAGRPEPFVPLSGNQALAVKP